MCFGVNWLVEVEGFPIETREALPIPCDILGVDPTEGRGYEDEDDMIDLVGWKESMLCCFWSSDLEFMANLSRFPTEIPPRLMDYFWCMPIFTPPSPLPSLQHSLYISVQCLQLLRVECCYQTVIHQTHWTATTTTTITTTKLHLDCSINNFNPKKTLLLFSLRQTQTASYLQLLLLNY